MLAILLAAGVTGAVSISVLDRSGAMVTDLRAEEVTLKEAGQTPSAAEKRSIEVKVARKDTKVRVRPAGLP